MDAHISPGLYSKLAPGFLRDEALGYPIGRVRTIEKIRHTNLLRLLGQYSTDQAFADAIDRAQSQVSQVKNRTPHSRTKAPRNIDSDLARHIEVKLQLPVGWMDNDHERAGWPFPLVDRELWEALDDGAREHVQRGINALLLQYVEAGRRHLAHASEPALGYMHEPSAAYTASPEAAREAAAERNASIERARRLKDAAAAPRTTPTQGSEAAAPSHPPKRH